MFYHMLVQRGMVEIRCSSQQLFSHFTSDAAHPLHAFILQITHPVFQENSNMEICKL